MDLLNLPLTTISRDLKGKYICLYGKPKVGKTTFAVQAPRNLLLAFEKGYNAIAGIKAIDIPKWSTVKEALRELRRPEVQAAFDTVSIDTVGIMWEKCEEFVCAQAGVQAIGDIPWGRGYASAKKEFESVLREITMLGYGLIVIAHVDIRTEKVDDGNEVEIIAPAIPKRAYEIVNQMVDIIGYIATRFNEDNTVERALITRATPTVSAGSRFPHLPGVIPFGYKELSEALADAIEKSGAQDGAVIVDKATGPIGGIKHPFEDTLEETRAVWDQLIEIDPANEDKMYAIIEKHFGQPMKLSKTTEKQQDVVEVVLGDFKELLARSK